MSSRFNFSYAEGPRGQRVIIVPPKVQISKEEHNLIWCLVGFIFGTLVASILVILGITYESIELARHLKHEEQFSGFGIAGTLLIVIGLLFFSLSLLCWRHIVRVRSQRVLQYMHKDELLVEQTTEEQDREEYGFGVARRSPLPQGTSGPLQSYPDNYGSQYSVEPGHTPRAARQFLPSQRSDYYSSDQNLGRGSPSSYHSAQRLIQGHSAPYLHHNRQSPGHSNHPIPHGIFQYPGATTPSRSSPVVDRSFSPSSGSTYLSHGSRTDIPLDYRSQY